MRIGTHYCKKHNAEDTLDVDRVSVLEDLFECETWFQDGKRKVMDCLMEAYENIVDPVQQRQVGRKGGARIAVPRLWRFVGFGASPESSVGTRRQSQRSWWQRVERNGGEKCSRVLPDHLSKSRYCWMSSGCKGGARERIRRRINLSQMGTWKYDSSEP